MSWKRSEDGPYETELSMSRQYEALQHVIGSYVIPQHSTPAGVLETR